MEKVFDVPKNFVGPEKMVHWPKFLGDGGGEWGEVAEINLFHKQFFRDWSGTNRKSRANFFSAPLIFSFPYAHGLNLHVRPSDAQIRPMDHRCQKYNTQDGPKSSLCMLQVPWNSIEHKVRNSIILTFTSFSIAHAAGKPCFLSPRTSSDARLRHRQKAYWP
jgi:hypothetical protein